MPERISSHQGQIILKAMQQYATAYYDFRCSIGTPRATACRMKYERQKSACFRRIARICQDSLIPSPTHD